MAEGKVAAVAAAPSHHFSKISLDEITLVGGQGVQGDAHQGATVKHRSRVRRDPSLPNLRQVHLIHAELFDELQAKGFAVAPAQLGENVTTRGIDLLSLPRGALLRLGASAVLEVTGLRNPCSQIENYQTGLLSAVLERGVQGKTIRKSGIMAIVLTGGTVRVGDAIGVELPPEPHLPLECV